MAKAKKIGKVDRTYAEQSVYGRTISSSKLPVKLQLEDGKYLGDVSYDAYKAIIDGKLDNYQHKNNEEKKILEEYKKLINYNAPTTPKTPEADKTTTIIGDFVPGTYSMTKSEYDRRRASNPNLPEFGSYEYFKSREESLRPIMDEIADDMERRDDAKIYRVENYENDKDWMSDKDKAESERLVNKFKYQDAIIAEYKAIDEQLKRFETDGVHYDKGGNIDTKSGSAEAKYVQDRYETILAAEALSDTEFALGFKGELPEDKQEKYNKGKQTANLVKVEMAKEKAYDYYEKNKDNVYNNHFGGRVSGNYRVGDINVQKNNASYASFNAGVDDLEASDVYNALSERIQKNNSATFQNNTKGQELLAVLSQYIPQARDQLTYEVLGRAVGLATGSYGTGNFFGSAGSAAYMYRQTAGATFERLLRESDLSVEDVKKLASSEALASSTVEFGLSAATGMLWKTSNFATKGAVKKVVSESAENMTKRAVSRLMAIGISEKGANIIVKTATTAGKIAIDGAGEGIEEWIQEGMSIKADRYAKEGKVVSAFDLLVDAFDLSEYSSDDFKRMNQSFLYGTIIGFGHGGFRAGLSKTINSTISKVANAFDSKKLGEHIIESDRTDLVEEAVDMIKETASTTEAKAIERIETAISDGKQPSAIDVGTVVKSALTKTISVGDVFVDAKTGNKVTVVARDSETTTVQVNTSKGVTTQKMSNSKALEFLTSGQLEKVESPTETKTSENATTTEETSTNTIKTINLKRVGNFYEVYGADAVLLASEFDSETAKTVVNGIETDVLRIPSNLAEGYADAVSDEYNIVLSDKPIVEKQAITNENTITDETTPTTEENATENEISAVVNAMNDTFKPKAREDLMESEFKGDVVKFAELVSKFYKQNGTLSFFADYFTDEGAKVISAIEGKIDADTNTSKSVVDVIGETLTPEAKADLQNGDVNANYNNIVKMLEEVYKESGTLEDFADLFVDGGKKVEAAIKEKIDNTDVADVLKNESESDTIESETENASVEREDNDNGQIRESVLSGDGRRRHNESTRKQVGRVSYFEQRNQGRNATERQNFARELIERGQVEEVIDGKDKYTLVNPEAYNDDMLAMVEEAKKHGIELGFFVGSGIINYDTKDEFTARGIRLSPTRIVVQYDNVKLPQKIAKHEIIHAKWNTEAVKRIRTKILKSLSSQETKDIFAQKRYARYKKIYKNDNLVLEEFVCDVMSGANEYYERFADTVNDYWYGNEELDSYNVAEYSESIDAGGKETMDGRYDLSDEGGEYDERRNNGRGISGISKESGNKRRRNTSDKRDVSLEQTEILHPKTDNLQFRAGARDKRSGLGRLVRGVASSKGLGKSGEGKETESGRIQQTIDNNDSRTENEMLNEKAIANGYVPVKVYKGTQSYKVRTVFDKGNAIWVTPDYDYANRYSSEYSGTETEKSAQLHTEPNSNVYELYAKYGNVLELGDIEQEINTLEEVEAFAKKTGITPKEVLQCRSDGKDKYETNQIWAITNTKRFAELARNNGYDSLHALEDGGKVETYGILYSENVKSAKLKTYDDKGKLIPLSKRFDTKNNDIRYDLDDTDTEYLELAKDPEKNEAKLQDMVDDAAKSSGYNVRAYHGTSRADRVGNVFLPERATSGPMAFFTDNKDIAEGYSKSKIDTSMAYDPDFDSYETQFRIKIKDRDIPLYRAWGYLPFDARNRITKKAQQLREDWDGDNEFILDPDNKEANGGFQWQLKEARGNTLLALNEQWLNSGTLFNEENRFLEVLEMTGVMEEFKKIGLDSIYFKDPKARHEKVYDTYLRITNPFDTSLIDNSFVDELTSWYEEQDESKYNKESMESDLWDKNGIDAYEFADRVRSDIEKGTFHAWTSIPDSVTDYLKSLGYDGIKDLGGKNSDVGHTVWIPFSSEQIKSAEPVTYDDKGNIIPLTKRFNKDNKDIRYDLDEDSDGNPLTEEQIEFFKDSQARDKNGNLKVLYHGSPNEFDVFDKNKSGKRGTFVSAKLGFYFTDDITYAKMMGNTSDKKANVFKAYLNIKNPLRVLTTELFDEEGVAEIEKQLKGGNYDGIIDELGNYVVFESNQIKLTDNTKPTESDNIRYDISEPDNLETQKKVENMAKEITSHEEFIELTKQNTKEFVDKIKENKSLQKRLHNAKRQMLLSPNPTVNPTKAGKVTKDILNEMDSTLNAKDLQDRVMGIYNEYFADMKKAKGVESKVQEANDNMMKQFADLAVDIADSSVAYLESEYHTELKAYLKRTRIKIPDHAKGEVHFNEFRKAHMGTFNLTNDGLEIGRVYQELIELFPGTFSEDVANPADQLNEIADALERLKPYAYNPHSGYMQDAIDHIVYRFVSEADGIAVMPKTKAQKIAEKGAYDKEMALEKERAEFERKLDRHKENSEKTIRGLQKKIDDAKYVRYWEKRLSKEEKAQAVKAVRDKRDIASLKTDIRNIVSDMKKKLDKTEKNGGYPKELVQAAAEVCSVIDFQTGRTNKDGTPTKASLKLDALKMQYDALKNSPNYDFQSEHSEEISNKILKLHQKVENKRVVDLTKTELSELKDILSEINHTLSEASKQIGRENAKANYEIATEIIDSLKLDKKSISEIQNQLLKEMRLAKESGKAFVVNPHRIFEMIANYDRNSAWWQLYDQILRGSRKVAKFTMDATKPFDELTDGSGNEIAFYDFRTKNVKTGIKYTDGTEVEIPKSIICELVMLWDRKQGRSHLEFGGVKIPDLKLFNKGKTADALAAGKMTNAITQSDITRLKGMLDSYDKAWIERSRHLFNKVAKEAINETSMQLVGRELAKADNYIRIYVDSDFVKKDIGKNESDITIEGHGSLKETTPEAKNPVVVRGLHENIYEHIDFASKYYGLAIPIRNFNKVYKISIDDNGTPNSVKNILGSVFGPKIRDGVVVQVIKDLQSPRHRELSFFNKVKGGWLGATFWANIRSALKQTTSYWTASSILDEGSLVKGLANYATHRKQTKAEIAKYSGTLYKRSQGLSTTELGDRANRKRLAGLSSKTTKFINEHLPVLRKIPEWIRPGNWLQSMDCAVSSALWDACKHQVSKTMNESDNGYFKAVADLYERVIEETQSNYDVLHRPEILKSTNAAYQTIGMFQNDNLQQTGIMYSAFGDLIAKHKAYKSDESSVNEQNLKDAKKRMDKAIRSRIYSSMWIAFVSFVGDALLRKFKPYIDDEEKEITAKSVLEQMMMNMSEDMLTVFVPIVGQLTTKAVDTFSDGYDFLSDPAFDVLEDFIKSTSKIWKAYEEDGDVLKAWTDAIPSLSNMTGVPAKNISDLFKGIKGYIGDIKAGDFAHDLEDYTSGNKSFYNYGDLASYIVSGDKEKETKWLDYYSANGKEFAKGSLTKEIKPAYVQMFIDSPEKANVLKRKLVLDYNYTEADINEWIYDEYLKHIVPNKKFADKTTSNPEYAIEIRTYAQENNSWQTNKAIKAIQSHYKSVYKNDAEKGNDKRESSALRKALLGDGVVLESALNAWELQVDNSIKKEKAKSEAEKKKLKD